jgi:formate-dependent phosphoribosylglycinamide formyltransferase (GAR transformylase)
MEPRSVVFVAPFLAETTLRFIQAAARLPGVRLGLISQDGLDGVPEEVVDALDGHVRVQDGLDPEAIVRGTQALGARIGPPQRLIGALEQLQVPLARVRERLGIPGAGVQEAINFRDKARMKDVLREAGVPCARHGLAHAPHEALLAAERIGFPLVVKPPAGAGAKDTFRVEDRPALEEYLRAARFGSEPLLLEEFIAGEEHSFDTVSIHGRPIWHSLTHYTPGPLTVMQNPWMQWTVLLPREIDHPRYDPVRRVAFRALEALGISTGLTHMEWFRRPDGSLAVSEVAARPPGAQFTTLISYAHDMDFYRAWARLMIFEAFDPPPRHYAAGIAFLRGQGQGRVRAIHGLAEAQQEMGEMVVEVRLPRLGQPPSEGYEGDGYVVLRHRDTARVAEALARLVQQVRVELG